MAPQRQSVILYTADRMQPTLPRLWRSGRETR